MSTLAAARADNFYYSKNYNPDKIPIPQSQLNKDKPFTVVQGQRVCGSKVRYETPFHVRCESCQNMTAKGVRFNAVKTWVGNFHSTKIYEFRMKCPHCIQRWLVRTAHENCEYIYVSGAKRIFQTKDCTDETRIRDEKVHQKIAENPFFKLEVQYKDKEAYGTMQETIQKLQMEQERGNEDFELNRILRKQIKKSKESQKQYLQQKRKRNLHIPLLSNKQQDEEIVDKIKFKTKPIKKEQKLQKYEKVKQRSQRDRLKDKLKNLHPSFKKILKTQIKNQNRTQKHYSFSKS